MAQSVIGWKAWYWDAVNGTRRFSGKVGSSQVVALSNLSVLPPSGLQVMILYYDKFSVDGLTRYRRIIQGNDFFYFKQGILEPIFGQTDDPANPDLVGAIRITGTLAPKATFDAIVAEAMADMSVQWL